MPAHPKFAHMGIELRTQHFHKLLFGIVHQVGLWHFLELVLKSTGYQTIVNSYILLTKKPNFLPDISITFKSISMFIRSDLTQNFE